MDQEEGDPSAGSDVGSARVVKVGIWDEALTRMSSSFGAILRGGHAWTIDSTLSIMEHI